MAICDIIVRTLVGEVLPISVHASAGMCSTMRVGELLSRTDPDTKHGKEPQTTADMWTAGSGRTHSIAALFKGRLVSLGADFDLG